MSALNKTLRGRRLSPERLAVWTDEALGRVSAALDIASKELPANPGAIEGRPGGILGFELQTAFPALRANIDGGTGEGAFQGCDPLLQRIDAGRRGLNFLPTLHPIEGVQNVS